MPLFQYRGFEQALRTTFVLAAGIGLGLVGPDSAKGADALDETKLPPAATNRIDFIRDIKPILDQHCLKCHGAEKPKSGFRVDNREMMLKGGENGVAVLPGQSGKSALIHYVARLVPDLEMPPKGKGEPLSSEQIALLRGWIDQEMPWGGAEPSRTMVDVAPTAGWITLDGNERKFRELEWRPPGWDGGLEKFLIRQDLGSGKQASVSGHVLRDDYQVKLSLAKGDRAFVRGGFEQYRKYYGDEGGYHRLLSPQIVSLDRDLFLDWGRAWIEAGGVLPGGVQLTAGYEYQFKEGEKSLTQWLPSSQGLPGIDAIRSAPTAKGIDEKLHLLRLDAAMEWPTLRLEDRFRYEFYQLQTRHTSVLDDFPLTIFTQRVREADDFKNLANAFSVEVQPLDWLLASAGYLYRHVDGTTDFQQRPVDATGQPAPGLLWNTRGIPLEQSAHVFNANVQLTAWEGLVGSGGVQTEWNRQQSFGAVNLDETDPGDPAGVITNRAAIRGDYDRLTVEEHFGVRFTQIPFTLLYGEARLRQERLGEFESQSSDSGSGHADFLRDTDASYDWQQYRAGFSVSPWSRVSLNAYYQRRDRDDRFDHERDVKLPDGSGPGYPAFITARETESDEVGARLVLRPVSWLKTTLSYKVVSTDFRTRTDDTPAPESTPGGWNYAGNSDAHIYALNTTFTPWRRLYLFTTLGFQDTRTVTADHGSAAVAPFQGRIYSALASATYLVSDATDVFVSYDFSHADYSQNNREAGLPLGVDYERHGVRAGFSRQFWKRFLARAEYAWFFYDEPSSGHFNDYVGHGVFGTLNVRWD